VGTTPQLGLSLELIRSLQAYKKLCVSHVREAYKNQQRGGSNASLQLKLVPKRTQALSYNMEAPTTEEITKEEYEFIKVQKV
jgi:hypothetical protein